MKNKWFLLICFGLVLALCLAYLIGAVWKPAWELHWNATKYRVLTVGDYEMTFYGSLGQVRKVKIEKEGKKLAKVDFHATADTVSAEDFTPFIRSMQEGGEALFIPIGRDQNDLDFHATLYLIHEDGMVDAYPEYDMANPIYENGVFYTEQCYRADTADSEIHEPPYKVVTVRSEYAMKDGRLCLTFEQAVIYYSETDIYCVATRKWDESANALGASSERWLFPSKYKDELPELQANFHLPIPGYDVIPR